ncbi:EpsG family protein [Cobetia amphilecti]|uniref:EpsG family protein n=1 Tax=Cobetia amphilecti TaxID=1055104 RepID=UPI001CDB089F|nr:EpsG family protein [Cobetia amphilecti]UBU47559.1 EpsG family protein [Cobetia amphilecti]
MNVGSHYIWKLASLLFALLYAFIFFCLPIDAFYDRVNYLFYAENSYNILLGYMSNGFLSLLTNEPIWLLVNVSLSSFLNQEYTLRVIIFFSAFLSSYVVLITEKKYFILLIVFLLMPQVVKNNIVHLRQGLAIALFLYFYFCFNKDKSIYLILITPFVHSSFFFIVFFIYITEAFRYFRASYGIKVILFFIISVSLSILSLWLASKLGARQGERYELQMTHASGLGLVFWSMCLLIFLSQGSEYIKNNSLATYILVFYTSTYLLFPVSARIFESAILIVLLSGLKLRNSRFLIFISMIAVLFFIQWTDRLGEPGFGWGRGIDYWS